VEPLISGHLIWTAHPDGSTTHANPAAACPLEDPVPNHLSSRNSPLNTPSIPPGHQGNEEATRKWVRFLSQNGAAFWYFSLI
jgi:hypothetical protein